MGETGKLYALGPARNVVKVCLYSLDSPLESLTQGFISAKVHVERFLSRKVLDC